MKKLDTSEIIKYIKSGATTLKQVSDNFKVSPPAIKKRLLNHPDAIAMLEQNREAEKLRLLADKVGQVHALLKSGYSLYAASRKVDMCCHTYGKYKHLVSDKNAKPTHEQVIARYNDILSRPLTGQSCVDAQ